MLKANQPSGDRVIHISIDPKTSKIIYLIQVAELIPIAKKRLKKLCHGVSDPDVYLHRLSITVIVARFNNIRTMDIRELHRHSLMAISAAISSFVNLKEQHQNLGVIF